MAATPRSRARWTAPELELASGSAVIAKLVEAGERPAEIERKRWEIQQQKWRRDEAERRLVQNTVESREDLFAIVEDWGVAKQIEGPFEDAERRASDLGDDERDVIRDRIRRARELLGGVDALQRFLECKTPDER